MLEQLPQIADKSGWPWTTEFDTSQYRGVDWPRITIITPSYNQGQYIEQTIRSVLLQNYPNLEYIIMDGGSIDNSVDIIRKYERWITNWISEKDNGQTAAINKGLKLASGQIFNWINSDDYLAPGALFTIAESYTKNNWDILAGGVNNFVEDAGSIAGFEGYTGIFNNCNFSVADYFNRRLWYHQPGIWFNRFRFEHLAVNEEMQYVFDLHLLLDCLEKTDNISYTDEVLVNFRLHNLSKTTTAHKEFLKERGQLEIAYTRHPNHQIATLAKKHLDYVYWHKHLENIRSAKASRWNKLLNICLGIVAKPLMRLNRFSLGAIKYILKS